MPNWKKVIVSGSSASLSSLNVTNGITGSLLGTSSYALNADLLDGKDSSIFATTGSNIFKGSQTIHGNLFMSGTFPLVYNNDSTNNMLFGMFDGSSIYGPYYQLFGNQYSTLSQRGGAEFVYDIRNNADANFHIASFNGSTWTQKFLVNDTGVQITGSLQVTNGITGSLLGTASFAVSASSALYSVSSSYAATASSADTFIIRNALTASGLIYPTTDGTFAGQVLQTDAAGNLTFGNVNAVFETIYNGEATTITKGTALYVSGASGATPIVYRADASNPAKMPVTFLAMENIGAAATGRGITLGLITGINLTGYPVGTDLWTDGNGTLTDIRPTGSNDIIQPIGIVTKTGNGGQLNVLNPGPVLLPNIQSGYTWIGDGNNYPTAVATSSIKNVVSSSYANFAGTIASGLNITASNVLITNNLSVQGTASFGYVETITGSAVIIGDAYIILNTQTPTSRFAGLQIYDSGSATTASIVWDSQTDHFVYSKSSGSTYSGGMFIAGPKNTGALGQEQTLTQYKIPVAQGDDHIMDSQIYSSGSITQITGSLSVSAGITGSLFGTASWASNAVTASYINLAQTASYVLNAVSASYAATASYVNPLNQNVLITGSLTIGATILGSNENTLVVGPSPAGGVGEGGQILLQAAGGTYTSASMLDVYQDKFRLLRGTNASSDAFKFQLDLHTGQIQIPNYNSLNAFPASGLSTKAFLGVDSNGFIMTVNSISGSLGVGTTGSAVFGRIDASNDVVAFSTSDINFKENIIPINNALEKINKVGGYEFDWKQDEDLTKLHGFSGHDVGVIAQEIEEILPEVVTTRDNGYKAVKYEKIVPLLIQAIKELQQEINELKANK